MSHLEKIEWVGEATAYPRLSLCAKTPRMSPLNTAAGLENGE